MSTVKNVAAPLKNFDGSDLKGDVNPNDLRAFINGVLVKLSPEDRAEAIKGLNALSTDVTLRNIIHAVAGSSLQLPPEKVAKLFVIAVKIPKSGAVELDAEDVMLLKEAVTMAYKAPILVGQVTALLEGREPFGPPA